MTVPKSRDEIRRAWRSRARGAGLLEHPLVLQRFAPAKWDAVANAVASRFGEDALPEDIRCARELESLAREWRLELEIAFVDGHDAHGLFDPALDTKTVRDTVVSLGRTIPKLMGAARTTVDATAKRRRMELMRFVQLCIDYGAGRWPRRSDDEDLWSFTQCLAPGLDRAAPALLDQLVVAWHETRPGAKAAGGRSKWRILSSVLASAWGDTTPQTQLKKEWVEGRRSFGFFEANRYSRIEPNARGVRGRHDADHELHDRRPRPRVAPQREDRLAHAPLPALAPGDHHPAVAALPGQLARPNSSRPGR